MTKNVFFSNSFFFFFFLFCDMSGIPEPSKDLLKKTEFGLIIGSAVSVVWSLIALIVIFASASLPAYRAMLAFYYIIVIPLLALSIFVAYNAFKLSNSVGADSLFSFPSFVLLLFICVCFLINRTHFAHMRFFRSCSLHCCWHHLDAFVLILYHA